MIMTIAAIVLGLISVLCTAHMAINWDGWATWRRWLWVIVVLAMVYTITQLTSEQGNWMGDAAKLIAAFAIFFFLVSRLGAWSAKLDEEATRMTEKYIKEQRRKHRV